MKKLKLLLASILALIMALGVTACGDGGNGAFAGDYKQAATEEQVQNLAEKIEGKAQATDLLCYEMVVKQTLNYDGMKTVTDMKVGVSGTSATDMKMSGTGNSKITMQGQTVKGKYNLYMTDGWMYIDMTMAGYTEKYKQKVFDPSAASGAIGGSSVATQDLSKIIEDGQEIFIDEQADGTTKIKATYKDVVQGIVVEMTAYFILDAEGNTTAIRMTCDTEIEDVVLKIDITMTAKDVAVSVPDGIATDSSYELM